MHILIHLYTRICTCVCGRSLVCYRPWGLKGSDTTEQVSCTEFPQRSQSTPTPSPVCPSSLCPSMAQPSNPPLYIPAMAPPLPFIPLLLCLSSWPRPFMSLPWSDSSPLFPSLLCPSSCPLLFIPSHGPTPPQFSSVTQSHSLRPHGLQHWRREWQTIQYSCLESPMRIMKRQKYRTLKDELPRSVGAQNATEEEL